MKYFIIAGLGALIALTIASIMNGWMESGADIVFISLLGGGIGTVAATATLGEVIGRNTGGTSGTLGIMLLYAVLMLLVVIGGSIVALCTSVLQPVLWWSGGVMAALSLLYFLVSR